MTAQISETLIYNGEEHAMCSEPLGSYFGLGGKGPEFRSPTSACWRGYVGTWEVVDNRLYLIKLRGWLKDGGEANLENLFPGYPDRVFAHWFTATARLPQGKELEYVHMGYGSRYERDLFIRFEKGFVVDSYTRKNGVAKRNAPDGYGIGGFTTLSGRRP